jgi:propionyl-CoA synthetase
MKHIYGVDPGEVYWAASDVGWVVGHSYIVYAPLFHGCTTVLYEGKPVGTPDAGGFWRVSAEHSVSTMFTAPTAFRAIRQQDPEGEHIARYDLSGFRALFLAGERCDPETLLWAQEKLGVPVIDHWWQTETGWPISADCLGIEQLPVVPGSTTRAVPGWDVHALDKDGNERPSGEIGALVVKLPMPPGASPTLWNADERFREVYLRWRRATRSRVRQRSPPRRPTSERSSSTGAVARSTCSRRTSAAGARARAHALRTGRR